MINVEIKLNLNEKWINPEVGDILRSEDGRTGIYLGDHPSMVLPGDFYVLQIGIITKPKTLFFPKSGCTFFKHKLTIENDDGKRV